MVESASTALRRSLHRAYRTVQQLAADGARVPALKQAAVVRDAKADDQTRRLAAAMQALNRARTEPNRIRAAVLLTLPGAGPPDDARAIALLESVSGKTPGTSPVKQLAAVLLAQVAERMRATGEERRKSAAAQEKLDQLRAVERSLLLERNRNAGGAGGGGGGGGTGR